MNPKLVTALDDIDRWRRESDADADREHNEISEEQERQLAYDIDTSYAAYYRWLESH